MACTWVMSAKAIVMKSRADGLWWLVAGLVAFAPLPALGHAALVEAEPTPAVRLQAAYDTGEPMAEAQVIIYAPDNPARAWSRGATDAEGRYLFAPDSAIPGRWTVQVRQAGHGAVTYVEIGASAEADAAEVGTPRIAVTATGSETTPLQRVVMIVLVAWGALGTALFFRRRRGEHASA